MTEIKKLGQVPAETIGPSAIVETRASIGHIGAKKILKD